MSRTYESPKDPLCHATLTSSLLDCINQMAMSNDMALTGYIHDLIAIAAERAEELVKILDAGGINHE